MKRVILILLIFIWYEVVFSQQFTHTGPGGGSSHHHLQYNPFDSSHIIMHSDMSEVVESCNGGKTWNTVPFYNRITAGGGGVQFTAHPDTLYYLQQNFLTTWSYVVMSADGGEHWHIPPGMTDEEQFYSFLSADPSSTQRFLFGNSTGIYFSGDGGISVDTVFTDTTGRCRTAGVYWNKDNIYIGHGKGLHISQDGGQTFYPAVIQGMPQDKGYVAFCGASASDGKLTRIFGIVRDTEQISPDLFGNEVAQSQYVRFDHWETAEPELINLTDFDGNIFFTGCALNNTEVVWVAGNRDNIPQLWKSEDAGQHWQETFFTVLNQNIETGNAGYGGQITHYWSETALGLGVFPTNPNIVVFTDFSFAYQTHNGGQSWQALYVLPEERNPAGASTPPDLFYHSNGLENTSIWTLFWVNSDTLLAGLSDFALAMGVRDQENRWKWCLRKSAAATNTVYEIARHQPTGKLIAATSGFHDLGQSTYIKDQVLNPASPYFNGSLKYSSDGGWTWSMLHDFKNPVTSIVIDPLHPEIAYASVVHRDTGGIFRCNNLSQLENAAWERVSTPPNTSGRPLQLLLLKNGTLLASYFAKYSSPGFENTSGIFASTDGGTTWEDRSHPAMKKWMKYMTLHPANDSILVAGAFAHWGCSCAHTCYGCEWGGLFISKDQGHEWKPIGDFYRVESAAFHPQDSNLLFVSTEQEGLWVSFDALSDEPHFYLLEDYPFMHPVKTYFNPFDCSESYVISFGNGIRRAATGCEPRLGLPIFKKEPEWPNAVCSGQSLTLDVPVTPNISGQQWVVRGAMDTVLTTSILDLNFLQPGTDTVSCIVWNEIDTVHFQHIINVIPAPLANWDYQTEGQYVSFINLSQYAEKHIWEFGDGQTDSVSFSPVHQYLVSGTYPVRLTVQSNCGISFFADTVQIKLSSTETIPFGNIPVVAPNPSTGRFRVWLPAGVEKMQIINTLGEVIYDKTPCVKNDVSDRWYPVDLSGLPIGVYTIQLMAGTHLGAQKVIISDN